MRVHITGGPGTGKTTLARALAADLGVEPLELDMQALRPLPMRVGGIDFETVAAMRMEHCARVAAGDRWVSDGSNVLVAQPLLERADVVIVLYSPWRVASYRILLRHFKANLRGNNRFPGIGNLYRFWRWSARYYANRNERGLNEWGTPTTQLELEAALQAYESKIVRCTTKTDIERIRLDIVTRAKTRDSKLSTDN